MSNIASIPDLVFEEQPTHTGKHPSRCCQRAGNAQLTRTAHRIELL
jgi:hypothetical protein